MQERELVRTKDKKKEIARSGASKTPIGDNPDQAPRRDPVVVWWHKLVSEGREAGRGDGQSADRKNVPERVHRAQKEQRGAGGWDAVSPKAARKTRLSPKRTYHCTSADPGYRWR
jgi:hypothetical protein